MIRFTISGTDARGREYEVSGHTEGQNVLDPDCFMHIGMAAFDLLTHGKAKYGEPGRGGCKGPYDVRVIKLEKLPT